MDSSKEIKYGALLSYITIFLTTTIAIVYTPVMLRYLGQGEYGLRSLAGSVVSYLGLLNLGIGSAMVRYITKYKVNGDKKMVDSIITLFLCVFTGLAFVAILVGVFLIFNVNGLFADSLTLEDFHKMQILMSLMTFNIALGMVSSVFYAVLMAYERFVLMKVQGLICAILNPLIMLPLLISGYKAIGITLAETVINFLNTAFIVIYCFRLLNVKLLFRGFEKSFLFELFGFSFFVLLAMIVDKVYWGTDQVILGAVSGTIAVAIYSVGSSFTTYFMSFSTAITGLFLPRLTEMNERQASNDEFTELFIKVGRVQFIILCFVLGGFIVLGKQFIILWAGTEYAQAYYIALAVLIPFLVPLIQNLGLQLLYARNKHKFRSLLLLFFAIVNIVLSIPAAKIYGGLGCAVVTGLSFIAGQILILNWYYYHRIGINIPLFWKNIFKMAIPFIIVLIISGFIIWQLHCDSWFMLLIGALIYTIIYCLVIWFVAMNKYEKELLGGYVPFLRNRHRNSFLYY